MDSTESTDKLRPRDTVTLLLLPAFTALMLKAQSLYFHHVMIDHRRPMEEPRLEDALLMLLVPVLALLPKLLRLVVCGVLPAAAAALLQVDVLYYRFFKELPSLHLLPAWQQSNTVTSSLGDLTRLNDLGLAVPLVLVLLGIALAARRRPVSKEKLVPVLLLGLWPAYAGWLWNDLHEVRRIQLQRRFQNIAIGRIFGPLFYHAYDFSEWGRVALGLEGGTKFDLEKVRELVHRTRDSVSVETPFKGLYEGRDLIFLQLESLEHFALEAEHEGQPIMPFLQSMAEKGFGFRLFDQTHLGRSSDGEFIFLNSLHPPASRALAFSYPNNRYYGLPRMFEEKGYRTVYLHPSDPSFWNTRLLATSYGFQEMAFRDDMPPERPEDRSSWGLDDTPLLEKTRRRLLESPDPSFFYVVTSMCHHPYPETKEAEFPPAKATSMARRYLRCAHHRDQALRKFVENLARTERGRRAVLCLVGDHDANLSSAECHRLGLPVHPQREVVPAVICSVEEALSSEPRQWKPPNEFGAQIDLAPSLAHVFSLNMEESVFLGWNLFGKQNTQTRISRVGPWMDKNGTIDQSEDVPEAVDTSCFEVSEMLLQGDRIEEIRHSL